MSEALLAASVSVFTLYCIVRFGVGNLFFGEPFWIWDLWRKKNE